MPARFSPFAIAELALGRIGRGGLQILRFPGLTRSQNLQSRRVAFGAIVGLGIAL